MDKLGEIEIRVTGKSGKIDLSPDSFDIKHLIEILKDVDDMLYPGQKKERPVISYEVKSGSVKHLFKTSLQVIIGFSAVLNQIQANNSIDFLEYRSARAFENFQKFSIEKNFTIAIKTSVSEEYQLSISPKTKFYVTENFWVDAEFYFYGILKDAGGKTKANIHIDTTEFGYLPIETGEDFLRDQESNLLYKQFGVRAIGKQNLETGEIDKKSLKLIELVDYDPKFDQNYLDELIKQAKPKIKNFDNDNWLENLRGDYEA